MPGSEISAAEALHLIELAEMAVRVQQLPELAEGFLPGLAKLIKTPAPACFHRH
jgi:hypothetical protein